MRAPITLRVLRQALGSATGTMKEDSSGDNRASCAVEVARLIEDFYRTTVPSVFQKKEKGKKKTQKCEGNMVVVNLQGAPNSFETQQRMANVIVEFIRQKGECVPMDLLTRGFSYEEVESCWPMAFGLAKVDLDWMEE